MDQSFCKEERLCNKNLINKLFNEGEKQYTYPIRAVYLLTPLPSRFPVQLLISVPRSIFRHAVDRNRVKRLIREVYRKNKHLLYSYLEKSDLQMALCITYTSKEIVTYEILSRKIIVLLQRLIDANAENPR